MKDDDFKPKVGVPRARGGKRGKRYAHQLLAAINRAGGRSTRKGRGNFGRGGAMAAALISRDQYAAFRQRRVIVKARIVRLAGKGMTKRMASARAHLRYIQRDGVTRDGERGELYSSDQDRVDGKEFLDRTDGDRHQFRFIVAPEDGIEYDELKSLTRRLMTQMEEDLGTRLDWVAVDHFNTGHPHTHIMLRGKDDQRHDLVISRGYIGTGMRERAAELVSIDLGPRTDLEIEARLRNEVEQERLTSIDKQLRRIADGNGHLSPALRSAFRQTLLIGRLKKLERMELAMERHPGQWRLNVGLEDTLRRMGERGDIIKTLHREITGRNIARSPVDYTIHDPANPKSKPVTGRVVARGLSDEINDRHYLIVDGLDGRAHYIDIGNGDELEPIPEDSIIRVTPKNIEPRKVDITVAEIAAASDGRYNIDLHLKHDPHATENFAEAHVRRLEAIRRAAGSVMREPNGAWIIAPDHLDRVVEYERRRASTAPVMVEKLSQLSLEQQVGSDGATWLDWELIADTPQTIRDTGFGRDVREARERRRQWLIAEGLAQEEQGSTTYRTNMLATLRRRELTRVAGQLSDQLGLAYSETRHGASVEGTLRRSINLASGKYAVIEKSREFTLVPWRPVLDRHIGQHVSGTLRGDSISWTIGRQRSGPSISLF
ncbi:relaxase/mobilization nuclease RlxS [Paremcibacter congregatus]|uniref:relaxase/mobilization nuclease RlxS n=1 Tax=Paremcibacter congregatus TaxID=2043170 RepID=UPI0030EC79D2|tara:strand:- start:556 stop:2535 length:1980 start_codon:yes stop_codon:yes gene_type:complete